MRLRAFRWWILACGGGHLLYRLLLHIVLAFASPASPSPASPINDAIPFWFVFDVLLASLYLIVGGFQWLIIRKYFARPYGWLSVIALQCGVDWFIRSSFEKVLFRRNSPHRLQVRAKIEVMALKVISLFFFA